MVVCCWPAMEAAMMIRICRRGVEAEVVVAFLLASNGDSNGGGLLLALNEDSNAVQ